MHCKWRYQDVISIIKGSQNMLFRAKIIKKSNLGIWGISFSPSSYPFLCAFSEFGTHILIINPNDLLLYQLDVLNRRVRKNWRDIYFLMFTRPGHFFLYLFVVVPVVRNWLTRYQMKDMDIIFQMIPFKSM